ncbi:hypothetical protein ZWY2020_054704 [Hordeum vulgare]|nr:hypothetical protein ZWY2020_054704 [Hordeum vulgare]
MFTTGVGITSGSDGGSGGRIASQRAQQVCNEQQFGRSGSAFASGAGTSSGSANKPVQPVWRVGLSRRQPSSRASSFRTTTHSLNLAGGFSIDMSSSFFQGVQGSSNGNTGESSEHDGNRGFGHVQSSGSGLGGDDNASGGGYRGDDYNPSFENADEYPPSIPQEDKFYNFVDFSIEGDKEKLQESGLEINTDNYIDIQRKWRVPYMGGKNFHSLPDVARSVIYPFYKNMK